MIARLLALCVLTLLPCSAQQAVRQPGLRDILAGGVSGVEATAPSCSGFATGNLDTTVSVTTCRGTGSATNELNWDGRRLSGRTSTSLDFVTDPSPAGQELYSAGGTLTVQFTVVDRATMAVKLGTDVSEVVGNYHVFSQGVAYVEDLATGNITAIHNGTPSQGELRFLELGRGTYELTIFTMEFFSKFAQPGTPGIHFISERSDSFTIFADSRPSGF